jgi:hypothetical protein
VSDWQRRDRKHYGVAWTEPVESRAYERRRPGRPASLESDVAVPIAQSVFSALVAGLAALGAALAAGWQRPALWAVLAALAALVTAWLVLLRQHRDLLWEIELVTGADLDRDGTVGVPLVDPEPRTVRAEIIEGNGQRIRYIDVPLSDQELEKLADGVLQHAVTFSRRSLADAGLLEAERYSDVKDVLLEGGLLRYRGEGPHAGLELSPAGRAFLRQYL